jgi:peptidoglycan/LPS O-acetylase OafA/YrhL
VIAITMLDIDLSVTLRFAWVPIVLWLAMGDLRWLVGSACLRMSGLTWARSAVRGLPLMGAAWIVVPLAGVGHWTGQLGSEMVVWLLGAAAIAELEGDWRAPAARSIANARRVMGSR